MIRALGFPAIPTGRIGLMLNRNLFQPIFIAVHILHRTIGGDDHGE